MSQEDLVKEYFQNHPNREIKHPEIVDWLTAEHQKRYGRVFRDPDRTIRKLSQNGFLIKVSTGVYKHDPQHVIQRVLEDFTPTQKEEIYRHDNYQCVVCGKGKKDGVAIHADHIKPKDLGGKAEISNGQTLCATHNFQKKNYNQTTTGKKMFIHLYEAAKAISDTKTMKFCSDLLEVYERNGVNGHIEWKRS